MAEQKAVADMTIDELYIRKASAIRRVERYTAMGNDALTRIAAEELAEVNAALLKNGRVLR